MIKKYKNKMIAFALLATVSLPIPSLADDENLANETTIQSSTINTTATTTKTEKPESESTENTTVETNKTEVVSEVEAINTEEDGIYANLSEGIPTLEEVEKKAKEKEEKDKKKDPKKDVKDPYDGEKLKKEKPRHYNTVYKGSKLQWENKAISKERRLLKETAENWLGWDYSQAERMAVGKADCSSFVHRTLMAAGLMPKSNYAFTTYTMPDYTDYLEQIKWEDIKVGDIILGDGHVAFYWGEDSQGHPITLESCGRFGVGYGYMMYGGWDFNYTSVWRVKGIDNTLPKKVKKIVRKKELVSIWDLVVDEEVLENDITKTSPVDTKEN